MVENAVFRADKIVRALLDFSRMSQVKIHEPHSVNDIIKKSVELVQNQLDLKDIRISIDLEGNLPNIEMDKNQLEQVFVNIISNAIYAMPKGGNLKIRSYMKKLMGVSKRVGRRVTDLFDLGDMGIVCEIEDTGLGISKENLKKVFDPFFTTKPPGEGTGLGLSICSSILEKHKGLLDVESEEGVGTKVVIMLHLERDEKE